MNATVIKETERKELLQLLNDMVDVSIENAYVRNKAIKAIKIIEK